MGDDPQQEKRTTSWKIVDGNLPSDLREAMRAKVKEHSQKAYPEPMLAPWFQYPEYPRSSMGWRMGSGEDYMIAFRNWFEVLGKDEKASYQQENQEPEGWNGFYEDLKS